jgi:putative ABC transport system substrate-binding protein
MRRRQFLGILSGVAAWPLAAGAQQPERMRRIGALMGGAAESDAEGKARLAAFLQGLAELGWVDGRNLRIDFRSPAGNPDNIRKYAAELVALAPDVIFSSGSAAVGPLLQATRTVPIVFVLVPDPVGAGFIDSLARPGGNATGFTTFEYSMSGKWLELLKEVAPGVTRVGVAGFRHICRDRPVWRGPGRGAIVRSRGEPDQCARCAGNRARYRCLRALRERRLDRDR